MNGRSQSVQERLCLNRYLSNIVLPNVVFFDPTDEFLSMLPSVIGDGCIIDCGAGGGHATSKILEAGINIVGIDTIERHDAEAPIMQLDSTLFPFQPGMFAMIARPCRGDWIQDTMDNAISRGAKVIYAGLEKHFEEDLYSQSRFPLFLTDTAGRDGEWAFLLEP